MILCGNNKAKECVQIYSLSMQKHIYTLDYSQITTYTDPFEGMVMETCFSHDANLIFAGDSYKNDLRIFMNNADGSANFKTQAEIHNTSPVYTVDANPRHPQFAYGTKEGFVYVCNYSMDQDSKEFEPYQGNFLEKARDYLRNQSIREKMARDGVLSPEF